MFKSFFHGLARAFTVPRSVRNKIDNNPLAMAAKNALLADLLNGVSSAVDKQVSPGSDLNAAIKTELGLALQQTGVLK